MSRTVPSFAEEGLKRFLHGMDRRIKDLERRGDWRFDQESPPVDTQSVATCPTMGTSASVYNSTTHDGFPGLAIAANGSWIAMWRSGSGHASTNGTIVKSVSNDEGVTWTTPATVLSSASWDYRGATLLRLANGNLLAFIERRTSAPAESTAGATVIVSTDNGATWSSETVIAHSLTAMARAMQAVQLSNGNVVVAIYGRNTADAADRRTVVVSTSTDGGASWSATGVVGSGPAAGKDYSEAGLAAVGSTLVCLIREDAGGSMDVSRSTDNGASWSTPVLVASSASGRPTLAVRGNGDIVNVHRSSASGRYGVLTRSSDNGSTWSTCHTFSDVGGAGQQMVYAQPLDHPTGGKLVVLHAYERTYTGGSIGSTDADIFVSVETSAGSGGGSGGSDGGTAPSALADLTDVDITSTAPTEGQALVYDAPSAKWIPGVVAATASPDETVFAPSYTATDGASLDLAITFVWGIDATGDPYYNAAGVTAGDEAVLVLNNTTGELSLRPVEV